MLNFNLNPGGIAGGFLVLCVGVGMMFLSKNPAFHDHMANVVIIGVIFGAVAGNIVWYLVFGTKAKSEEPRISTGHDNMTACPMCGAAMLKNQTRCNSCGERPAESRESV